MRVITFYSFLKELNYSGVAMIEYKLNPETGDWVFIEINARFWGSLPLAVAAGADTRTVARL